MERKGVCLLFCINFSFSCTPESFDHDKLNPVGSAKINKALMNLKSRGNSSGFKENIVFVGNECFCISHPLFLLEVTHVGTC